MDLGCQQSTIPWDDDCASRLQEAAARVSTLAQECTLTGHGTTSAFERYLRELSAYPIMGAEEELLAARTIERTEIEHWVALLSFLPVAGCVLERLLMDMQSLPEEQRPETGRVEQLQRLANQDATWSALAPSYEREWRDKVHELARSIRLLDADRAWMAHARQVATSAVEHDLKAKRRNGGFREECGEFIRRVSETERAQRRAKHRFVEANLRLVVTLARRYGRGGLPFIDVVQEGNIGLLKAVERFDHTRGYRFSTFALWWIRHAISRAVTDKGRAVRIPAHLLSDCARALRARDVLRAQTGLDPTSDELERQTRLSPKKLRKIRLLSLSTPVSLDRELAEGSGHRIGDTLVDDDLMDPYRGLEEKRQSQEIKELLAILTPRESRLVAERFGLDDDALSLEELGHRYQLSREGIRRRLLKTLRKMHRQWLRGHSRDRVVP